MSNQKPYPVLNELKCRIKENGISYKQLSEYVGISLRMISARLNGYTAFTGPEMAKVAEYLDINPLDVCRFFMPTYQAK